MKANTSSNCRIILVNQRFQKSLLKGSSQLNTCQLSITQGRRKSLKQSLECAMKQRLLNQTLQTYHSNKQRLLRKLIKLDLIQLQMAGLVGKLCLFWKRQRIMLKKLKLNGEGWLLRLSKRIG